MAHETVCIQSALEIVKAGSGLGCGRGDFRQTAFRRHLHQRLSWVLSLPANTAASDRCACEQSRRDRVVGGAVGKVARPIRGKRAKGEADSEAEEIGRTVLGHCPTKYSLRTGKACLPPASRAMSWPGGVHGNWQAQAQHRRRYTLKEETSKMSSKNRLGGEAQGQRRESASSSAALRGRLLLARSVPSQVIELSPESQGAGHPHHRELVGNADSQAPPLTY
ncbi:hypothetical protein Cadr_000010994 [Camelus dromedarius]|uniref:Uncharacterized protein n=1 Tax=Camelus dromedarius TaxID=9838 RepID=A0A5N4DS50_CAMDR|nr:hypothetical protein Cadr_000010994 [Camelus dromedarius]